MHRDILLLIDKIKKNYKEKSKVKKVLLLLSCFTFLITIYFLILPGITLNDDVLSYKFNLKDSYDYSWKENYTTEYNLNLYFMDLDGNYIEGCDIDFEIGENAFEDDPYSFGSIPINGEATRGLNLIDEFKLNEYALQTGEKYEFQYAEVLVGGTWQKFLSDDTSTHWDIWCQSSSSSVEPASYGWRGKYGSNVGYTITNETEFRFIYKLVRQGVDNSVSSLGLDSGITFQIFNYEGNNTETGVNANGLFEYFSFRGLTEEVAGNHNLNTDADGFVANRAKVLPNLENGYPVFNCQGYCENSSLGYLFGSSINPKGEETKGVKAYQPLNTLLQKETIDNVEYYYYDSNKNAVDYDTENNRFMLRNYVERNEKMGTYLNETSRYEFLPFNYYLGNELLKSDTNFTYNYKEIDVDHWFGMTMEFSFYMPRGGMINDTDMIFSFSGDDDVWVFVDDVLVLDLGGTHGAVNGSINFKTGKVESYLNWNGKVGDKNTTTIYDSYNEAGKLDDILWNSDNTTYANYTLHKVKFFYLERGASVSNCTIRFNIPVLPSGTLSVSKKFLGSEQVNENYEFTLYDTTNGVDTPVSNATYKLGSEELETDENGKFTLKKDEVAIFKLTNNHTYYVKETNSGYYAIPYSCTMDGITCNQVNQTNPFTINPESSYQTVFTNKVKTFNLKLSKIAYGDFGEDFTFQVNFKNKDGTNETNIGEIITNNTYEFDSTTSILTFNLKDKEEIVINDIPINTNILLKEIVHDGYNVSIKNGDVLLSENDTYEFILDANKEITIYNTPGVMLPETGGRGIFGYLLIGSLIIVISFRFLYRSFKLKEGGY